MAEKFQLVVARQYWIFNGIYIRALSSYSLNYFSSQDLALGYKKCNMPHRNNINFPEYKFALLFLHTTENNSGKEKQH